MKNLPLFLALFFLLLAYGCKKDKFGPELNGDGLTRDITDLIPEEILDAIEENGMPLYGGGDPPEVEGTYLGSPMLLLDSNIPDDEPGTLFVDVEITLSRQNNEDLTIASEFQDVEVGASGEGSFIVGEGNNFSVFIEYEGENSLDEVATFVKVLSGTRVEGGIEDFHCAVFMIDNNGNPTGSYIEEGQGRVLYDSDGFSEEI